MKNFNLSGMFDYVSASPHKNESHLTAAIVLFGIAEIFLLFGAVSLLGDIRGVLLTFLVGFVAICGWKEPDGSMIRRLENVGLLLATCTASFFVLWLCGFSSNRAFGIHAPCFELVVTEGAVLYAAFFTLLLNYKHIAC